MDKTSAQRIVLETFKASFDKKRYRDFISELCNGFDESKVIVSMGVPDAFKSHVKSCQRLGTFESADGELADVLIVHLTESYKLERTRTALRDFVAHKLKRDESYKEAGFVAFVAPDLQWRFSYVRMEYETKRDPKTGKIRPEERLTPARRYSYLVGADEECHTAQSRFLPLLQNTSGKPALAQIEDAFSVESVTKEFFEEYKRLFVTTDAALAELVKQNKTLRADFEAKHVNTADFTKKLLGQIVFLYFIQKKGWLGVAKGGKWGDGPRNFLRQRAIEAISKRQNLFNDVLEPLFYDTLATDRGHEAWCGKFQCRIPFLNGGLFEPLAGYDWENTEIALPNTFLTNRETNEAGDIGTGILDVFDRYNFTVIEDEPLEKEVAIDPEMLGKVFENLLEVKERKSKGSFYTPREIVHYMCQESLINYLDTSINNDKEIVPRNEIEILVHLGEQISHYEAVEARYAIKMPKSIDQNARLIDEKLAGITVCDPAIGSGAFPVGMMQEIARSRSALTPYFNDVRDRTPYHFKRHAIQNCLYGVDIDTGAVEIAKLRLWLSLVVDEDDVKQIKPLPNLDYKIVVGNSLIGFLFKSRRRGRIEELKQIHFDETGHAKKVALKEEIDSLIHECFALSKKSLGYEVAFDFEIYFSEVFQAKGGFDVVIANPPYLRVQGLQEAQPELVPVYKKTYRAAQGSFDLYGLFIERGFRLLHPRGHLSYIVPHKFFQATFAKGLRELLNQAHALRQIVRFGAEQVFESATTYTCLLFLSRERQSNFTLHEVKSLAGGERILDAIRRGLPDSGYESAQQPQPATDDWDFHIGQGGLLLEKLADQGVTLGDITHKIFVGLQTSADKIYVLRLLREEGGVLTCYSKQLDAEVRIERGLVKPFLMGKNVHRYAPPDVKNVVIFPYEIEDGAASLMTQSKIKSEFPLGWKYLMNNREALEAREKNRMVGQKFYAYIYPKNLTEFEAVKIMTPDICLNPQMSIDLSKQLYHTTTLYSFVFKEAVTTDALCLLGILNSKLLWHFMTATGAVLRGGYIRFKTDYLRPFPIACSLSKKPPTAKEENEIVELVKTRLKLGKAPGGKTSGIEEVEQAINAAVYRLYDLTPDEIALIEAAR